MILTEISSEVGLLNFFHYNYSPMFIVSTENRQFLEVNQAAINHYGYTREEFLSLTLYQIKPKEDIDLLNSFLQQTDKNVINKNQWRHIKKNGEVIWVTVQAYPILFQGKQAMMSSVVDISADKKHEETIQKISEELSRYQTAINAATIVSITDDKGTIQYVNAKFVEISGFKSYELIGKTHRLVSSGKHNKAFWLDMWTHIKQGKSWRGEICNYTKNKEPYWLDASIIPVLDEYGAIEKVVAICNDITLQKQRECDIVGLNNELALTNKALEQSTARLEIMSLVAQYTQNMVIIIDALGKIIWVNDAFCHKTEYSFAEALGQYPSALLHGPETNLDTYYKIKNAVDQGYGFSYELLHYTKSKKIYWAYLDGQCIKNQAGEVEKYVIVLTDVSELKRQKELVMRSESELNALISNTGGIHVLLDENLYVLNYNLAAANASNMLFQKPLSKGINVLDNVPSESRNDFYYLTQLALQGTATINREVRVPHTTIYWQVNYIPTKDHTGKVIGIVFTALDITVRKQEEDNTMRTKMLLSQAEIMANMGSWEFDLGTEALIWSDQYFRICGFEPQQFSPTFQLFRAIIMPEDLPVFEHFFGQIKEANTTLACEIRLLLGSNNIRYVRLKGHTIFNKKQQPKKILGLIKDITDDKAIITKEEKERAKHIALIENMPDPVFAIDMQLNFLSFNQAFKQYAKARVGFAPTEGMNANDYFLQGKKAGFKEIIQPCLQGQKRSFEFHLRVGGAVYYFVITASPIHNDTNEQIGVMILSTNITERKLMEMALLESNERFGYVVKATFDAIWDWNVVDNEIYLGEGFTNLFGYATGKYPVVIDEVMEKIHPEDRLVARSVLNNLLSGSQETWGYSYRFRKANGRYAHIQDKGMIIRNEEGRVVRLIGAIQDITKAKVEEQRLKMMESVVTHTNDGVMITQLLPDKSAQIIYVNQALRNMTGYQKEDLLGKSPFMLTNPGLNTEQLHNIDLNFSRKEGFQTEILQYRKDVQPIWVSLAAVPMLDDKGNITHWLSIQRNITEKKKRELEREQMLKELAQNNQELKQFSYITSHNLRAPLTNLMAIVDLLDTSKIKDAETLQLLEGFKISTAQLHQTLNDLMNILVIRENSHQRLEKVFLQESFDTIIQRLKDSINICQATVTLDCTAFSTIMVNPSYWESILQNLLSNAIRYAHPNRTPVVQVITQFNQAGRKQIIVKDNGVGMDLKLVKDKIFGLYQRFHRNSGSKGIGLYFVKSQLMSMGASIEVSSEVDMGSEFTITLAE